MVRSAPVTSLTRTRRRPSPNLLERQVLYGRGWDDEHGDTAYDLACKSSVTLRVLPSWPWYGLLSEIARSDPDIVEDSDGRVIIFEAHEGALRCNDAAFVELGGCGVAVHLVAPALLAGLRQQNVARGVTQAALQLEQAHVPQAGVEAEEHAGR